ncbi:MAG: hydrogenase 4 subunit B [Actinobacteria bacterium]|nr:MAG: hydrogenase 4 subunit B [Actinomycetota bacterium]
MSVALAGWLGALGACAVATVAAVVLSPSTRIRVVGALLAVAGGLACVSAGMVLAGAPIEVVDLPGLLSLSGLRFELDPVGAVFLLAAGAVTVAASVYGIGYPGHGLDGRMVQASFPLFVASLLLVPAAGSVVTFLAAWELMAVTSLMLVAAEHRERPQVREAAWWYGVMTHLSFAAILVGLLWFAAVAGGDGFDELRAAAAGMPEAVRSGVFLLVIAGFGAKAGMVPLHVWLPRAHPEAPSHVSALMSGVMVKLGVYGVLRVAWDLLGGGPAWWGMTVLILGGVSALFGILHALVADDLKRLLAYSTTENVGLILVGVGAAGVFASAGDGGLAGLAVTAALLHVVNHALFKGLLFLGAGSVVTAAGTRQLDHLGGLVRRMPVTAACFGLGSLAIVALPPLNGFVSEWLLLKSLVHGVSNPQTATATVMPFAVGAVALTGGLAAATFVKAFGTGFLALPRSPGAESAVEVGFAMRSGMVILAAACVVLGLVPGVVLAPLQRSVQALSGLADGPGVEVVGVGIETAGAAGRLAPAVIALALVSALAVVLVVGWLVKVRRVRRRLEAWACGRTIQTARMEYTATSFAEPLKRVFDDVLRPELDLDVSHASESRYYLEAVRYRIGISDAFESHVYRPLVDMFRRFGDRARRVHNGSIHLYLAYMLVVVLVVLMVSR